MRDVEIVAWIVRRFEGGYVNHPADKGGPTNFGVSSRLLQARYDRPVTDEDIRALTFVQAVGILLDEFVVRPRIYKINDPMLRLLVTDFAIHSGAAHAIRGLQTIREIPRDGRWGPITDMSVNAGGDAFAAWLGRELLAYRLRLMGRLIAQKPSQAVFAGGWTDRVASLLTLRLPVPDPAWPDALNV